MKSILAIGSIWAGVCVAFLLASPPVNAGSHICRLCDKKSCVEHIATPDDVIDVMECVECVEAIPSGQMTLVLNCPAEAHVWIDRHKTDSEGVTRQFHLQFWGDCHDLCVKIQLPNSGNHGIQQTLKIRNQQNVAWSVNQKQLETLVLPSNAVKPCQSNSGDAGGRNNPCRPLRTLSPPNPS